MIDISIVFSLSNALGISDFITTQYIFFMEKCFDYIRHHYFSGNIYVFIDYLMVIIALVISPNGFDLLLLGTLLKRIYSSGTK